MIVILTTVAGLSLAVIPLVLGWRRAASEAEMARALGVALPQKKFDPENYARKTGTGLSFRQLLVGYGAWTILGFAGGALFGLVGACLFAVGGLLLYGGTLAGRREDLQMDQSKDILRALGILETLLSQGRSLMDAISEAAGSTGNQGQAVLNDLVIRLRAAPVETQAEAVRDWTAAWTSPAVDLVGTALLAALQGRIEITPLVGTLRATLSGVVEVLSRARSAARGVEWQARFLALFPPAVMIAIALTTPDMGDIYAESPILLLPVFTGSGLSYFLSMRMIRSGLSLDSSLGLMNGEEGLIKFEQMGKVLK